MVARHPIYAHATVGEARKSGEKSHMSARHHRAVFIPVVEYVAQQVEFGRIGGYAVEEVDHTAFVGAVVGNVVRPQVQVADEINLAAHSAHRSEHSKF